jgi:hypothetical protein
VVAAEVRQAQARNRGGGHFSVMSGFMPGIHAFLKTRRGWPGARAFTPVFAGLCPAMTETHHTRIGIRT